MIRQPQEYSNLGSTTINTAASAAAVSNSSSPMMLDDSDEEGTNLFLSSQRDLWDERYHELEQFYNVHGHSVVPLRYPPNQSLSNWIKRQRYQYKMKAEGKRNTMTLERQLRLEKLGFIWDSHSALWNDRLEELRQFQLEHGHCNVPKGHSSKTLAVWVKCQRRQFKLWCDNKRSNMTQYRYEKLSELGFVFYPRRQQKKVEAV